jgi:Domain of unknown function (DUF4332)
MAIPSTTPLSVIEGIGPATARALEGIGAYSVFDLLRTSVETIHPAVSSLASVAEVRRWRSMAALLHVVVVTPQWAEALVRADVRTIADFRGLKLSELEGIFTEARRDGVVPDVPSAVDMAEMLKHAASLLCSGAFMGTVRDRQGAPIEGATVGIGALRETTDARGRFRIVGIPMLRPPILEIAHPGFRPVRGKVRAVRSFDTLEVRIFTLAPRGSQGRRRAPHHLLLCGRNGREARLETPLIRGQSVRRPLVPRPEGASARDSEAPRPRPCEGRNAGPVPLDAAQVRGVPRPAPNQDTAGGTPGAAHAARA